MWYNSWVLLTSTYLLYQETEIYIAFQYLISNSFNSLWVLKSCFHKHDCNCDDDSKIGYSGSSLKERYFET